MCKVDLSAVIHSEQPIFILFDCMRKANLRVTDIFHSFDKDKSNTLTREELKHGLMVCKPALTFKLSMDEHSLWNQISVRDAMVGG